MDTCGGTISHVSCCPGSELERPSQLLQGYIAYIISLFQNLTYIRNPGFPSGFTSNTVCTYKIDAELDGKYICFASN